MRGADLEPKAPWWKRGVFYQIYPRSFADSTGSGVGDLAGITSHLDHLAWLGVDALWISPFYPSPMRDFGYDVADYCGVDPRFGTLRDFDALVARAHELELRVIVDFVPAHTSSEHPWFVESRASCDSARRDWYVWRNPAPGGGPPNNWVSNFTRGGSAWTLDERTGQYYLHSFLPEQPDLNWEHPPVIDAMHDALRFWLDRGVDGFRIDVVHNIGKDPALPDAPERLAKIPHTRLNDDPRTHGHLRGIRRLLDDYPGERMAVGEVFLLQTERVAAYYGRDDELQLCFNFPPLFAPWRAEPWRDCIETAARCFDPVEGSAARAAGVAGALDRRPRVAARSRGSPGLAPRRGRRRESRRRELPLRAGAPRPPHGAPHRGRERRCRRRRALHGRSGSRAGTGAALIAFGSAGARSRSRLTQLRHRTGQEASAVFPPLPNHLPPLSSARTPPNVALARNRTAGIGRAMPQRGNPQRGNARRRALSDARTANQYDMAVVRGFAISALVWGIVGMSVGLLAALQLAWPELNWGPYLHFGRIRPVHTNAVIFGFTLGVVFAGSYYGVQRLCRVRMFSDTLSRLNLWGWNAIIVAAAVSLLAGATTSKEYAELEWPLDLAITVVWVIYAINVFGTIAKRREKTMYAAIWFWVATILTIAMLHIVNSVEVPVSLWKSYSAYAGVHDANIQWWYGHNAVGFLLTTPILGLMYYFLPKQAGRPIFSHRLSILHFWSLIFIYIWAGPHHLIYSPLPDWAQTFGTAFSVMLILPSWGGMLNGLLTLRGAWHRVRTDPLLKMFAVGLTFYGMSTFEGPMMAVKTVNSLSHFTNWTIGHVHSGALGWVALTCFATLYYLVPRLWHTSLYSVRLAEAHFWIATLGIVLYVTPMWVSGVTQGLMWRAYNPDGSLTYTFIETVSAIRVYDVVRAAGGALFLSGALLMFYNVVQTIRQGAAAVPEPPATAAAVAGGS